MLLYATFILIDTMRVNFNQQRNLRAISNEIFSYFVFFSFSIFLDAFSRASFSAAHALASRAF